MRAVVARSIKNVGNQQFFSVKAVFAFLFFRLWQADMCVPRNGQEELHQKSIKLCRACFLQKSALTLLASLPAPLSMKMFPWTRDALITGAQETR